MAAEYNIEKDYIKKEYRILEPFADDIERYLLGTSDMYKSDVDTLFCKTTQFRYLNLSQSNNHYTYANLIQCLGHYYQKVLVGKYNLHILHQGEVDSLADDEIERMHLGDTRHIAMISLMVSGGSATVCKELAGHGDIEIGHHYYSNIKSFLDVLSLECAHQKQEASNGISTTSAGSGRMQLLTLDMLEKLESSIEVRGGYCTAETVAKGDFTPCRAAVDAYGRNGICNECQFFLPRCGDDVKHSMVVASDELLRTTVLLRRSVEAVRKGLDSIESIECALERLRSKAIKYTRYETILKTEELTG